MKYQQSIIDQSPLGKSVSYEGDYRADYLFPIARAPFRESLGLLGAPPFFGYELWNAYEFSWLNLKGKPVSAIAQFVIPCHSPKIIESKSFKLYLNSFHQTRFENEAAVSVILERDLSACVEAPILLEIAPLTLIHSCELGRMEGDCLDHLDIEVSQYTVDPNLLSRSDNLVTETLYTDVFKSNCLGTGQPDWGSIEVGYTGPQINREQLLKYLISYRNHKEFNEHCVERIFMDILNYCQPQDLTVMGHFTRRGGLDTNPCRSTNEQAPINSTRFLRQ